MGHVGRTLLERPAVKQPSRSEHACVLCEVLEGRASRVGDPHAMACFEAALIGSTHLLAPFPQLKPATAVTPSLQTALPASWVSPADGSTVQLRILECEACGLNGVLPAGWNKPSLTSLNLANNPLSGGLRNVIAGSPGVTTLVMRQSAFNESLNETWPFGSMTALQQLDLSYCTSLSGPLPASEFSWLPRGWFGPRGRSRCLQHLVIFAFGQTHVCGLSDLHAPDQACWHLHRDAHFLAPAGLLTSPVKTVNVRGAGLSGPLPELTAPSNISLLNIGLTGITGSIPLSWLTYMATLDCFDVRNASGLCGPVPSGFTCFQKTGTNLGTCSVRCQRGRNVWGLKQCGDVVAASAFCTRAGQAGCEHPVQQSAVATLSIEA